MKVEKEGESGGIGGYRGRRNDKKRLAMGRE